MTMRRPAQKLNRRQVCRVLDRLYDRCLLSAQFPRGGTEEPPDVLDPKAWSDIGDFLAFKLIMAILGDDLSDKEIATELGLIQ